MKKKATTPTRVFRITSKCLGR